MFLQVAISNSVLNISRLEAGKVEIEKTPCNVKDIILSAIKMFDSKLVNNKALQIRCNFPYEPIIIKTDPNRLKQVVINLLSNALKFTPQGQIIFVLNNLQDNRLQVSVVDTGLGMTPEEKARLFNRFTQASNRIYHDYGGSGLGLVISDKLVRLLGGTIDVDSEKGKGTTFTFTIQYDPVSEQERELMEQASQQINSPINCKIDSTSKKILIVDDNEINQKVLASFLRKKGFQYHIVSNGKEAIEKVGIQKFDLIFMDVQMPIMDGYEATQRIRQLEETQRLIRTPILCLSGNTRESYQQKALAVGMDDYLTKPFDKEKIYEKLLHYLNPVQNSPTDYQPLSPLKSANY